MLAASRLFRELTDLDFGSIQDAEWAQTEKVVENKIPFPDLSVNEFPVVRGPRN